MFEDVPNGYPVLAKGGAKVEVNEGRSGVLGSSSDESASKWLLVVVNGSVPEVDVEVLVTPDVLLSSSSRCFKNGSSSFSPANSEAGTSPSFTGREGKSNAFADCFQLSPEKLSVEERGGDGEPSVTRVGHTFSSERV